MAAGKQVAIIGVPLDLGAGRRGVDMGPSAIRYAGLSERLRRVGVDVLDCGDVDRGAGERRTSRRAPATGARSWARAAASPTA